MVGGLKNDATLVGNPVRARAADKWKIDAVTERPHYTVVYLANPLIGRPPRSSRMLDAGNAVFDSEEGLYE
jgi:hypothetical protein